MSPRAPSTGRTLDRYEKDGASHRIDADFLIGSDGFHGPSRKAVPPKAIQTFERVYPFGWLVHARRPCCRRCVPSSSMARMPAASRSARCARRCAAAIFFRCRPPGRGPEPRLFGHPLSLRRAARALSGEIRRGPRRLFGRALERIWKAERLSWWMTTMLHTFAEDDAFGRRIHDAELNPIPRPRPPPAPPWRGELCRPAVLRRGPRR